MKIILIVAFLGVALIGFIQMYLVMSTSKTETQVYKILFSKDNFEIRFYPSVTIASITSSAKSYKELANPGFRKLAGYIFGGNEEGKKISMTSPVHMDINDSASTMSFVMPSDYHKDNLPQPNDSGVKIENTTDEYVAAIEFDGFASTEKIKKYKGLLENALKKSNLSYYGHFRFLGYNPPFQLFGRRNEIIVSLNWDSK